MPLLAIRKIDQQIDLNLEIDSPLRLKSDRYVLSISGRTHHNIQATEIVFRSSPVKRVIRLDNIGTHTDIYPAIYRQLQSVGACLVHLQPDSSLATFSLETTGIHRFVKLYGQIDLNPDITWPLQCRILADDLIVGVVTAYRPEAGNESGTLIRVRPIDYIDSDLIQFQMMGRTMTLCKIGDE